jgi:hypothetical protein
MLTAMQGVQIRGYDLGVTDLGALTAGDFEPLVHERFRFTSEAAAPFEVELIDVSEGESPGSSRSQFSLVFRGGPTPPLPQGIHGIEHHRLGRLDVFLVPIGPDADGQRYEAVFT